MAARSEFACSENNKKKARVYLKRRGQVGVGKHLKQDGGDAIDFWIFGFYWAGLWGGRHHKGTVSCTGHSKRRILVVLIPITRSIKIWSTPVDRGPVGGIPGGIAL